MPPGLGRRDAAVLGNEPGPELRFQVFPLGVRVAAWVEAPEKETVFILDFDDRDSRVLGQRNPRVRIGGIEQLAHPLLVGRFEGIIEHHHARRIDYIVRKTRHAPPGTDREVQRIEQTNFRINALLLEGRYDPLDVIDIGRVNRVDVGGITRGQIAQVTDQVHSSFGQESRLGCQRKQIAAWTADVRPPEPHRRPISHDELARLVPCPAHIARLAGDALVHRTQIQHRRGREFVHARFKTPLPGSGQAVFLPRLQLAARDVIRVVGQHEGVKTGEVYSVRIVGVVWPIRGVEHDPERVLACAERHGAQVNPIQPEILLVVSAVHQLCLVAGVLVRAAVELPFEGPIFPNLAREEPVSTLLRHRDVVIRPIGAVGLDADGGQEIAPR